jgi:hypothetical protein
VAVEKLLILTTEDADADSALTSHEAKKSDLSAIESLHNINHSIPKVKLSQINRHSTTPHNSSRQHILELLHTEDTVYQSIDKNRNHGG